MDEFETEKEPAEEIGKEIKMKTVEVICSRCGKHLGTKEMEEGPGVGDISHGLCQSCGEKMLEELDLN